ncbi:LCP family protein [Desulfosporosinus sp. BG]|uniref:LCP family protein n=1 Tax=Desulfosporosinus sp. BG TaxID=1633135 RepID=UPI0008562021|nr:LCP family protein [Desulfosporosinus sp. BG]ODA42484.1 Cell envelope-associated transcriptional attenuator LytR-CpsA-Psr, subfamily M [Desulfosporosinus sp. BG]
MRRTMSLILLAVALLGVSTGGFFWYTGLSGARASGILPNSSPIDSPNDGLSKRVTVLLIGADQRLDQAKYNTDSLILASVDPETQRISLLSIPRDTRVAVLGHGYVKINSVVALTDLPTLQNTVEELTGETIAGYIQTNFQGFKQVIDTLGGITVNVEKNMYYETGDLEDGYINLHKGVQRLDGAKALQYARFRYDSLADISRTARQQVVLKAVAQEMFQLSTVPKLPVLIPQLMQAVKTNLAKKDILALAKVASGLQSSNVISQTLPGSFLDLDGVSYWKVDPLEVKAVVKNLLLGKTTDKVIDKEEVDLLKPVTPTPSLSRPKVPGNSEDPNGQKSSGYQLFQSEE